MSLQSTLKQFKALSDRTRLRMFLILSEVEEVCSCDFAELFGFSAPTISRHTSILCEATLIRCRKDGRWVYFSLNQTNHEIQQLLHMIRKSVAKSEIDKDIAEVVRCREERKIDCCKDHPIKVKPEE
ncbi:MAG: ArsR/SmtB family transcription factor [Candidatus Rifleibacteriota bacterium]